jgi:hypothetical protein
MVGLYGNRSLHFSMIWPASLRLVKRCSLRHSSREALHEAILHRFAESDGVALDMIRDHSLDRRKLEFSGFVRIARWEHHRDSAT